MNIFTLYVFDERFRNDGKRGDLVFIEDVKLSVFERGRKRDFLLHAKAVFTFDIRNNGFHVVKDRSGTFGNSGNITYRPLESLFNSDEVIWINEKFGKYIPMNLYLNFVHNPTVMQCKLSKIPLSGLKNAEIYLSALVGNFSGDEDEIFSTI